MSFAQAWWLVPALLLPPALALAWWVGDRVRRRRLRRYADEPSLAELLRAEPSWRRRLRRGATLLALVLLCVALARPRWGQSQETLSRRGVDLVLAVDVSRSMLARDSSPSRLLRTRAFLAQLLRSLEGHRVALLAFAGRPQVLCPLTLDQRAVLLLLESLEPDNVERPGTQLRLALERAAELFPQPGPGARVVLLLSDGEDHGSGALDTARELAAGGVVIHSVAVGNVRGEPIPLTDEQGGSQGFRRDAAGRVVLTRLDRERMEALARVGGGLALHVASGEQAVEALLEALAGLEQRELEQLRSRRQVERYQLFLGPALLLLLLDPALRLRWRRAGPGRTPLAALLLVLLAAAPAVRAEPREARALVERGLAAWQRGQYAQALELFTAAQVEAPETPLIQYDRGATLAALGRHEQALEALSEVVELLRADWHPRLLELLRDALYNQGSSSFRAGDYQRALERFQGVLLLDPQDQDAKANLELALQMLESEPPPRQDSEAQQQPDAEQRRSPQPTPPPDGPPSEGPRQQPERSPGGSRRPERSGLPQRLTPQQAEQLLDALEERERADRRLRRVEVEDDLEVDW